MSNRQTYQKFLRSVGYTEDDVAPILDPSEKNSILATSLAVLVDKNAPEGILELTKAALENLDASTNKILEELNKKTVEKYSLTDSVFVGVYPTNLFDGQTVGTEDGPIVLVNNGALQLMGGAAQLLYSRYGPQRKAHELRRMVISYLTNLTVPDNSAFVGSWADFDIDKYREMVEMATAAEVFILLHEYGHIALQITEHHEEGELSADNWALHKIKDELEYSSNRLVVGPFIFLGLSHIIEQLSHKSGDLPLRTHPGASIRIAQAATELSSGMSNESKLVVLDFLTLVDSAITLSYRFCPSARRIFEAAETLQTFFPVKLVDMIDEADRSKALRALVGVATEGIEEDSLKSNGRLDVSLLPPGLTESENPKVFLYELPSGIKIEMVFVEKGKFLRGPRHLPGYPSLHDLDEAADAVEASTAEDFYIGRYPVLWFQYTSFCQLRNRELPALPSWYHSPDQPVVNVTVADAEAFCRWADLELPSEAEWEKAARGTDGRLFPWGNSRPSGECAGNSPPGAVPDTACSSPYGAEQMVGGVWEITADWLESRSPMDAGHYRVVRGADYRADRQAATVLSRHRVMPDFPREEIGFRVILKVRNTESQRDDWVTDVLGKEELRPKPKIFSIAELTQSEQQVALQLFHACNDSLSLESLETVQQIVEQYPQSVAWRDEGGYTPLLLVTAKLPYFEIPSRIASLLIDAGADVNAQTPEGSTSLHMLACRPQMYALEIADLILQRGADTTIKNKLGETPEMVARRYQAMGAGDAFLALLKSR